MKRKKMRRRKTRRRMMRKMTSKHGNPVTFDCL